MRFEVSERIKSNEIASDVLLECLEEQFKKISESASRSGNTIIAKGIVATFGSINRNDTTNITLRQVDDGWLLVADTTYSPSIAFWIILVILLFTYVGWLIPIAFYLYQQNMVRSAIAESFLRVKNEFDRPLDKPSAVAGTSIENLERLATLKEKGVITEEEFIAKKKQILGL